MVPSRAVKRRVTAGRRAGLGGSGLLPDNRVRYVRAMGVVNVRRRSVQQPRCRSLARLAVSAAVT